MSAKPDKLARMGIVHTAPTGGNDEVAEMMRLVDRLMTALLLSRREGNKFGDEDAAVQTRAAIEAHLTQLAKEAAQAAYAECARLGWKTPAHPPTQVEPVALQLLQRLKPHVKAWAEALHADGEEQASAELYTISSDIDLALAHPPVQPTSDVDRVELIDMVRAEGMSEWNDAIEAVLDEAFSYLDSDAPLWLAIRALKREPR